MSDFNRRIGGHTPTLSFLDGPTGKRHAVRSKNRTYQSSADWPRLGSSFLQETFNGEGLTEAKARDATFILTGPGTWLQKWAYLTADPMTIQDGKRVIAQHITNNRVKVRGKRYPHVNPLDQQSLLV